MPIGTILLPREFVTGEASLGFLASCGFYMISFVDFSGLDVSGRRFLTIGLGRGLWLASGFNNFVASAALTWLNV